MKNHNRSIYLIFLCSLLTSAGFAQGPSDDDPVDPGLYTLYVIQNLNFGAFSTGPSGGTVTVSSSGVRTSSGDITLLAFGFTFFNAIIDIEGPYGTIVTVTNGPNVTLAGSNGGNISLQLGQCDPASPFVLQSDPPDRTTLTIGGTLTVGPSGSTPPGTYSGTFVVNFNYE